MAKYEDKHQIGTGGFGVVWLVVRDTDGATFAKKKLQPSADADAIRRFAREVRILTSLDHPNIIKVIGVRLESPPYFYIMPLYKFSLRQNLPTLVGDEVRIRAIFERILDAVDYAHDQGVVHRDLKPENVLLNSDTDLVLSDFGLGREFDADSTRQTLTGHGLGTPLYMAPEQVTDAKNADARSDIYSLGRMLYELYTGPLTLGPQDQSLLPPSIAFVVSRCTQPQPDRRFQTVTEVKNAWRGIFDAVAQASELEELQQLLVELSSVTSVERTRVQKVLEYLGKRLDDSDLIHKAVMRVNPEAFAMMYKIDRNGSYAIIKKFVDLAIRQAWGFEYTDKIGDKCLELFDAIPDFEVRAELILCAAEVGVSHNRWHVMGIAGRMLAHPKAAGEALVAADRLKALSSGTLEGLKSYVVLSRLEPPLRPLFT